MQANGALRKWWAMGGHAGRWPSLEHITFTMEQQMNEEDITLLKVLVPSSVQRLRLCNFRYAGAAWIELLRQRPKLTALMVEFSPAVDKVTEENPPFCGLAGVLSTGLPALKTLHLVRLPSAGLAIVCNELSSASLQLETLVIQGFADTDADELVPIFDAEACRRLKSLTIVQESDQTELWPLHTDSPSQQWSLGDALASYLQDRQRCGALETLCLHLHTSALDGNLLRSISTSPCARLRNFALCHSSSLDRPLLSDVFPASKPRLESLELRSYELAPAVFQDLASSLKAVTLYKCILSVSAVETWFLRSVDLRVLVLRDGIVHDLPGLCRRLARTPINHLTISGHDVTSDVIRELCTSDGWAHLTDLTLDVCNRYMDATAWHSCIQEGTFKNLNTLVLMPNRYANKVETVLHRIIKVCRSLEGVTMPTALGKRVSALIGT